MLDKIMDASKRGMQACINDVEKLRAIDTSWRFQKLDETSYGEMLWKFWRRFDSFYPDKSFLE